MSKHLLLIALSLLTLTSTIDAQELVPRFYWAEMYDTLDVKKTSMEEMRQAVDSIDFTTVSEEDLAYLEKRFDKFQKRWMAVYGNRPADHDPASAIFVGGMDCEKCVAIVKAEVESVEGVSEVLNIDGPSNEVLFSFKGVSQDMIEKVIASLEANLMGCGYVFYENHMRETDEVKKDMDKLEILKEAIGAEECDKH